MKTEGAEQEREGGRERKTALVTAVLHCLMSQGHVVDMQCVLVALAY